MEVPEKEVGAIGRTGRIQIQFNGSDLYDSFEFRQMTHQLNKVMQASSSPAYREMRDKMKKVVQGSNAVSPTYFCRLNSPLYRHQLNRIYKESTRTPRKIYSQKTTDKGPCRRRTRYKGFVARLWMKVKQVFLGNDKETNGVSK